MKHVAAQLKKELHAVGDGQTSVHTALDDETPKQIAKQYGLGAKAVLDLNRKKYRSLTANANLKQGTLIIVPVPRDPAEVELLRLSVAEHEERIALKTVEVEAKVREAERLAWMIQCDSCADWFHGKGMDTGDRAMCARCVP